MAKTNDIIHQLTVDVKNKDKTLETRKIVLAHNLVEKTDTTRTFVRHTDVVIINLKTAGDASRG